MGIKKVTLVYVFDGEKTLLTNCSSFANNQVEQQAL